MNTKLQPPDRANSKEGIKALVLNRALSQTVKRAIRIRLQVILDEEEKSFQNWEERVKHKLNKTRQRDVSREFNKRIQAFKIVIYSLTPYSERETDVPLTIVRKPKK